MKWQRTPPRTACSVVALLLTATFPGSFASAPLSFSSSQESASWCARPRDPEPLLADAVRFASSDDFRSRTFRQSNDLPVLPVDSVRLVRDEPTCEMASRAYLEWHGRGGGQPIVRRPVVVAELGHLYLVDDGRRRNGSDAVWAVLVFDHNFQQRQGHYGGGY